MKVFIGVPVYAQVPIQHVSCLGKIMGKPPVNCCFQHVSGDGICRTRNRITSAFLQTECTDLLMLDSDLIWSPDDVRRICEHDLDVVGGLYPLKKPGNPSWVMNDLPGEKPDAQGLLKVRFIGTGFLRIRRSVFQEVRAHFGEDFSYRDDDTGEESYDYWPFGVHKPTRRHLSEDWYFCQRWLEMGKTVWADTHILLQHIGSCIYPIQP
jgi:hypothetical protein